MDGDCDLWVFGYGSLMWHPGFRFAEAVPARVTGYHRALCIYSMHYRGTPAAPGLVLGLDRGGTCQGMVFRVPAADAEVVRRYLRARELVTGVYRETTVDVALVGEPGGRRAVRALTFVAERAHPAYAGDMPLRRQARFVRGARGLTGNNLIYVLNTLFHLAGLGIRDRSLERLLPLIGPHLVADRSARTMLARTDSLTANARHKPRRIPAGRLRPGERKRFGWRRNLATR